MKALKDKLYLLPLLLVYVVLITVLGSPELEGDGIKYFANAEDFLKGQLTDPERPNIRNGPIFPLLLVPIVVLDLPIELVYCLNAFFLLAAAHYLFQLMQNWLKPRWAVAIAYAVVLYPPLLLEMPRVAYESLAVCLVSGYLFHSYGVCYRRKQSDNWLAAIFLGLLALTKLIFPYIILILVGVSMFFVIFRRSRAMRKLLMVHVFAYVLLLPYMALTYSVTQKPFFLANSGGEIMYWKSSPYEGEFGEWHQTAKVAKRQGLESLDSCGREQLFDRHGEFFEEIHRLTPFEQGELLSQKAKENRKAHPMAFVKNSIASLSRLFFNFPFSFTRQKLSTLPFILVNMFVLVMGIFGLAIVVMRMGDVPSYFWFSTMLVLAYIGGMTLLNGRVRHLIPIIPVIFVFLSYVYSQMIEIKWKAPGVGNQNR